MRRWIYIFLTLCMAAALAACGADNHAGFSAGGDAEAPALPETAAETDDMPTQTEESRVLIVWFSRAGENYTVGTIDMGNTAVLADMILENVSADSFEILPVTPYPDDYMECLETAERERNENARPGYVGDVENWDEYETVFFGYPIWHGDMPMIAYAFLENHDWNGKTLIPFNTHEGSGQAGTQQTIESICAGAVVLNGLAVRGNTAQNDREAARRSVSKWLDSLDFFG